ncbi:MAG: DUF3800 domain-containing protein [Planctomycetes bacterium]|nr:DUF3800 domain-containing protein [Planctomycetota bacterium]NOG54183.1 DUF3800 domain-containing protein [Planctomycetota bacterium]
MKFCYVDESGKGSEAVLVVAGIVTDSYRMHVTKKDWLNIIATLSRILKRPVEEFHTRHFYRGNGIWRDLDGDDRTKVMNAILKWLRDRKHKVVFSAIEKSRADAADYSHRAGFTTSAGVPNYWKLAVLHLLLGIQKLHQREQQNKGNTVLVMDRGSDEEDVADLSLCPPAWTDSFYQYSEFVTKGKRKKKNAEPRLNQIIDVPFFADSKKVGLLQIADLFAYLLRHYAELQCGATKPAYKGEVDKVTGWLRQIAGLTVQDSYRWPATGACECARWYKQVAPNPLLRFCKDMS